jgi:hypothetical protein
MEQIVRHLEAAVLILTGVGALKERLYGAYIQHLEALDLNANGSELPSDLLHDYADMCQAMHAAHALPGENVIRASVRKLSAADAERYAALIVRVFSTLSGVRGGARNVPPRRVVSPLAAILSMEPMTADARSG